MQFAGHLTEHAGRLVLSIGRSNRWRFTFKRLYDSFAFITWQQVAEYGNGSCTQMVQSFFERKIMQHFQNLVYNNKYDGLFRTRLQSQGAPCGSKTALNTFQRRFIMIYIGNLSNSILLFWALITMLFLSYSFQGSRNSNWVPNISKIHFCTLFKKYHFKAWLLIVSLPMIVYKLF